jgi:hypothetical protein
LFDLDTDEVLHSLMAALASGLVLHGDEFLQHAAARASANPDALALKMLRQHGQIEFVGRIDKLLARGNVVGPNAELNRIADSLLRMLLALNRHYYSGFSWLSHVIDAMPTKPANFNLRMTKAFTGECQEGAGS